jgi:hypothetical protein
MFELQRERLTPFQDGLDDIRREESAGKDVPDVVRCESGLPGGTPLSTYANIVVQGSLCGISAGVSSSRGSTYFDQRFFGSYTYTIGYADFSGGFVLSETKDKLYFSDSQQTRNYTFRSVQTINSDNQDPGIIKRDRFFLSTGLHPTSHSEISAQWARDVHYRDWTFRVNGIDRVWASPRLEIYGYLSFDRVNEDKQYRAYGGDLLTVGVKARRTITDAWSIYADVGAGSASGAESSASKQNAIVLFGIVYRYGYHQSTEVGHIGIRNH